RQRQDGPPGHQRQQAHFHAFEPLLDDDAPPRRPAELLAHHDPLDGRQGVGGAVADEHALADRKSTRLNSSHVESSYAVFCWKKNNAGARVGAEEADDGVVIADQAGGRCGSAGRVAGDADSDAGVDAVHYNEVVELRLLHVRLATMECEAVVVVVEHDGVVDEEAVGAAGSGRAGGRLVLSVNGDAVSAVVIDDLVAEGGVFFFIDIPATETYTLSLHDALPI